MTLKQSPPAISSPQEAERSPAVVFAIRSGFFAHTIHPSSRALLTAA